MTYVNLVLSFAILAALPPTFLTAAQPLDRTRARAIYLQYNAALKDYRAGRVSQCPYVPPRLQPNQTLVLLDLKGSGFLTHVWATGNWKDEWINFYFDDEERPSVEGKWTDVFASSNTVISRSRICPLRSIAHRRRRLQLLYTDAV